MRPSKHVAPRAGGCLVPTVRGSLSNERGVALVITLFVVALVTVLVLEYHFDAAVELDLAANYANDVQAYHLALAGVRFAQVLLQRDDAKADGPEDEWYKLGLVSACFAPQQLLALGTTGGGESPAAGGLGAPASADRPFANASAGDAGCVSLRITDEDSKLPINALVPPAGDNAPAPTTWVNIFQAFFASFKIDAPEEVVNALIDWIDSDEVTRSAGGAERSYYERLPVPYKPPDSRMRTPEELRLVQGLNNPEELAKLFPGISPAALADLDLGSNIYLTPFGAESPPGPGQPPQAKVNLNTAAPEVITALIAGLQPGNSAAVAIAEEIVARRQKKQFATLAEALQGTNLSQVLSQVADVKSTYFRIESVGVVGVVHKKIVAVLQRPQPPGQPPGRQLSANAPNMFYFKVE